MAVRGFVLNAATRSAENKGGVGSAGGRGKAPYEGRSEITGASSSPGLGGARTIGVIASDSLVSPGEWRPCISLEPLLFRSEKSGYLLHPVWCWSGLMWSTLSADEPRVDSERSREETVSLGMIEAESDTFDSHR